MLSQAGPSIQLGGSEGWLASLSAEELTDIRSDEPELFEGWDDIWGDRINELVFIGVDMVQQEVEQELDQCLLTEAEMNSDWRLFTDPLPEWVTAE